MSLDRKRYKAIVQAIQSHVVASGHYRSCVTHDPTSAPDSGITGALWLQEFEGVPQESGLNATSVRVVQMFRTFLSAEVEPTDDIDFDLGAAVLDVAARLTADFTLGGLVEYVDLLGQTGPGVAGTAGWIEFDDSSKPYRIFDATIPFLIPNAWTQER